MAENKNLIQKFFNDFESYITKFSEQKKLDQKPNNDIIIDGVTHNEHVKNALKNLEELSKNSPGEQENINNFIKNKILLPMKLFSYEDKVNFTEYIINKKTDNQDKASIINNIFNEINNDNKFVFEEKDDYKFYEYLFIKMNCFNGLLEVIDLKKDSLNIEIQKCDYRMINISDNLYKLLLNQTNSEIIKEISYLLYQIYNFNYEPKPQKNPLDEFIEKIIQCIKISKNYPCMKLFEFIMEQNEKSHITSIKSHANLCKKSLIKIPIISDIENKPKVEGKNNDEYFYFYENTTIYEILNFIKERIGNNKYEFYNSDNVLIEEKDYNKTLSNILTKEKKPIKIKKEEKPKKEPLVENEKLTKKFENVLKEIFKRFCNDDNKMEKKEIINFLSKSLNQKMTPNDNRYWTILRKIYDTTKVKNLFLTEELFILYFSIILKKGKEEIIWSYLNNLGYSSNLEKVKKYDILEDKKNMRYYLSNKINNEKLLINELREENKESNDINLMNFILSLATNEELYNNLLDKDFSIPENKFMSKPKNLIDNMYELIMIESIMEDLELKEKKEKEQKYKDKIYSLSNEDKNFEKKEKFFVNFIKNGYTDLIDYTAQLLKNLSKDINNKEITPYICLKGLELINGIYGSYFDITIEKKTDDFYPLKSPNYLIINNKLEENIVNWEKYKGIIGQILLLIQKYYIKNGHSNESVKDNLITNCFYLLFYLIYINNEMFDYILNDSEKKYYFDQVLESFLLYSKYKFALLVSFNNKLKKKVPSCKFITYLIDRFFSLIKSKDSDKINKIISNSNISAYIFSVFNYNQNESQDKIKAYLKDIILNISNLIQQISNDNFQNKDNNNTLINYLKLLKRIIPKNRPDLKGEITINKINNEQSLYEMVLDTLLHIENEKLSNNKNKFLKIKELMNPPEKKFISYNEVIDNIKNEENREINPDKDIEIMKELNDFYTWCSDSADNYNKIKSIINKFNSLKKKEEENIMTCNSISPKEEKPKILRKKYGKNVGLTNLGTTCYVNSIMQLLFMIPAFRFSILSLDDKKDKIKGEYIDDDNMLHQMQKLFAYLLLSSDSYIVPQEFFLSLKDSNNAVFSPNNQKDSYEFYSYIYEKLELILKSIPNNRFLIQNFFLGKTCNISKCEICNTTSKRYEEFMNLSLKVENIKNLEDSLDLYIAKEKIEDYNCDKCQKKVNIYRNAMISQLPNYLVIHLQRIIKDFQNDKEFKLNNRFEFPLKLNMKKYFIEEEDKNKINKQDDDYEYNLIGINIHKGNAEGGHFVSVIKEQNGDKWYEYDDQIIRDFDINNLDDECFGGEGKFKTANLLFYEKVKKQPIIKVLNEEDVKEKQNIVEKNLEENYDIYDFDKIYLDQKDKFYYQFASWDFDAVKNIPKEYFLDIFTNSKIYFKLLANNCIHNLDNFCIKILLSIFRDKQFNIKDYNNDIYDDLLNILLNAIITYYYRENNNEENKDIQIKNQEIEKDIKFIIEKIVIPIIRKAELEKNNLLKTLEKISDILFNKDNLLIIFSKDSVINEELTKQMYELLNGIIQLNNKENNKKLFKDLNQIINNTKETKEMSFYVYQIIFDFFKNNIIDKINLEEAKNIFMPLYYKLYKEKNEENIKNITDILKYLITDFDILTKNDIQELKQVFNVELYISLFNINIEFLVVLTQKLQYDDLKFSNIFNTNFILKLYTYCEKNDSKEKKLKYKLMKYILSLLEIVDKYTMNRIELLLGYPSLVFQTNDNFGVKLMDNKIEKQIYEYINYNHIKKERCVLAHLFPSVYLENIELNLDEQDRLDLIYELISISLGLKQNAKGNYFLFKYLYLMQSRSINYENLYQEIKMILEKANNKKYDLSLIKNKEIKCIEIVNYEKDNLEYIITLSSNAISTVDIKKKKYKVRPELPEVFGNKELLDEKFNIDYYGLIVNLVPYEIYKIFISLIASNDNLSIFRFEYFTNYFTRKELLTFHDEKKEFTFDFINHENNEDDGERGDFEEISYRDYLQKKDFNQFLREIDEILKEKEGIEIINSMIEENTTKKTMIRYFVLSKKKNNVLKLTYKMYEVSKDIEKNFYLPDTILDCVEKDKDRNILNIHRIKHNFKFLEKDHLVISLNNMNYEKYMEEYFN